MAELAKKIRDTKVASNQVAIFYLAQAGICLKTSDNKTVMIDAYLSDACERLFNFKRMIPSPIKAEEVEVDIFASTHFHADHLDPDTVQIVAKKKGVTFVGARDCENLYIENQVSKDQYILLKEGEQCGCKGIEIRAIYADHGTIAPAPDAVGMLVETNGIKIYHAGDTCYAPGEIFNSLDTEIDVLIVPINGQFGNMNAVEAAKLAEVLRPKVVIPVHFWMFLEHVSENGLGDPFTFLQETKKISQSVRPLVMAPGECFIYSKN